LWPEVDTSDFADIDMYLYDGNCGAGATLYAMDLRVDTVAMVRTDNQAAGKSMCLKLSAFYVPNGETRRVDLFSYYSAQTEMR